MATRSLAGIIIVIGITLAAGGAWLILLGGSAFYFVAGAALIAAGYYLFRFRLIGVWIYVSTFAVTFIWALAEAGLDGWAHVPRLVGPLVLLVLVLCAVPVMQGGAQLSRLRNVGLIATGLSTIAFGAVLYFASRPPPPLPLPSGPGTGSYITDADWTAYGGTYGATRYSTLDQINSGNAHKLERAWIARTRDLPADMHENSYGAETTPLKIGDTLYLCSAKNILIALDPATGRENWRFDPKVPDEAIPYTAACRGVSYHEDASAVADEPCRTRIIEGSLMRG